MSGDAGVDSDHGHDFSENDEDKSVVTAEGGRSARERRCWTATRSSDTTRRSPAPSTSRLASPTVDLDAPNERISAVTDDEMQLRGDP